MRVLPRTTDKLLEPIAPFRDRDSLQAKRKCSWIVSEMRLGQNGETPFFGGKAVSSGQPVPFLEFMIFVNRMTH